MEFNLLSVSLTVHLDNVDLIKVTVNDKEITEIIPDSESECFSVPLLVGINMVKIAAINENDRIDEISFSVFRKSDLESKYKNPPAGFKKDYFHMKDHPECAGCHILEPGDADRKSVNITAFPTGETKDIIGSAEAGSTCYSCHKRLTSYGGKPF